MTRPQLDALNARLDAVSKSAVLIKWIVGAIVAATVWGTTIQIQTTKNTGDITEIREDRRAKIKDAEAWRAETDKANVKRDLLVEMLAKAESARSQRPR